MSTAGRPSDIDGEGALSREADERLRAAEIAVIKVRGNHDALSKITGS